MIITILELAEKINCFTGNLTPFSLKPKRKWDNSGKRYGNHLKAKMEVRTQPPMNPYQALGLDVRRDGWNYYSYRLNPIPLLQLPRTWGTDVDRPFRSYAFGASPLGDVNDTFFRQMIDIDPNEAPPNNIEKSFLFDWLNPSFNDVVGNNFHPNPWLGEDSEPEQQSPFRFQLLQVSVR